ncbi:hypothetical protein TVAG_101050 [Trichomonas vaginalis G3]|uniref:Uncharacterized protein n=1 Tax=Trichomonas vaginalis (strain ATCC PRA-98 / G3) TaxID=412133 RepID=A2DJI8_TRIV3|nr:serine-type endopeptidase protein [Trichomonas vaginalis G3]EAY19388.1 hypothetical protein TVAG_101050 [Trichomonas vaginalis G3]KAI5493218.1 serine-type endopeptidase protein [Trichomonas vaginalis G3]|eukprot:XP_001580374.1 hypothetical protein [Trichomonas vaginalis G3]
MPYVPSVFKDQLEMILIVDSMDPKCIYSSNVSLNYRIFLTPGIIRPKNGTVFSTKDSDLNIEYALQLERIFYDGYSTSTAATILSPESKAILTRKWIRNVGNKYISNIIPSTKKFYLQISPASTDRLENFDPMTIELFIVEQDGNYRPIVLNSFSKSVISVIIVLYVLAICCLVYRYIALFCLSEHSLNCYFD